MEPIRTDYTGAWVGGIVPALLDGADAPWLPSVISDVDGVVLLVCDGLGWNLVERGRTALPTLSAMEGGPITTVVPSTTSAGLTSIVTGAAPSEHGLAGYRIRIGGEPVNVLAWQTRNGPDPVAAQPLPPFGGREVPVVTRAEFRDSGFTVAHLRDTPMLGWRTTSALVEHCRRLADGGAPLVYAYYDGVDKVAHEYGLRDGFLTAELAAADRLVDDLLDVLPASWALLVTSDHGQVHVDSDGHVALDDVAPMIAAYSGEGRFRTLHARGGAAADLLAACEERYGPCGWVFHRDRLFDEGWLGPAPAIDVRGRIGDVVLAARDAVIFVDPTMPLETLMSSHHGSLTADEMLVPLLAARGRA